MGTKVNIVNTVVLIKFLFSNPVIPNLYNFSDPSMQKYSNTPLLE